MRILAFLIAVAPVTALAWTDLERSSAAQALGDVLASEEPCGLTYDQDAIGAHIDASVPADDAEFTSMLTMMTMGAAHQLDRMSASALTAHCRQIERVAKSYGFIQAGD